jgi:predicted dehydrogenase
MKTVSIGLVGLGGYAQTHLMALRTLQSTQNCRIVAACDPFSERHPEIVAALEAEGAGIYSQLEEFLARTDIDAVTIATPIHLHAPQTCAALEAGKAVYLEKPPCATLGELDNMVEVQSKSKGLPVRVGFQMQTSGAMRWIKSALLEGRWGALQTVFSSVRWPRNDNYYNRSPWAATWRNGPAAVFDGPATNALSHVVFAALFLGGTGENDVASPLRVRGSLMRARPVQSYDSALMEAELPSGVRLRLAFTHATIEQDHAALQLDCEHARIYLNWNNEVQIEPRGTHSSVVAQSLYFPQATNQSAMNDFLRVVSTGERGLLPTLEDARGYVQLTCGALHSSAARTPDGAANFAGVSEVGEGAARFFVVEGLDEQMQQFAQDADAVPQLFNIEEKPWIDAADISPTLAV